MSTPDLHDPADSGSDLEAPDADRGPDVDDALDRAVVATGESTGMDAAGSGEQRNVARALAEITAAVLTLPAVDDLLARVARVAAAAIGGDCFCGITLRSDGRTFTVATSHPHANRLDELQYTRGEGPCLQSLDTGQVVSVPDLTDETRWGSYPTHALAEGVRSSLSLPLSVDDTTVGALNLYDPRPDAFSADLARDALLLAAGAAGAIALALRLATQVTLTEQMQTALASRAVIDQAIGIVIRGRRCTPAEAFAYLRTASQHRNVKLNTIAIELVTSMARRPAPGTR